MPHAYTEDQLVEQPAIGLLAELGWTAVSVFRNLRQTRNLLLPRLLSGQVELDEREDTFQNSPA
jgi:type I restriction enzyme R subunit